MTSLIKEFALKALTTTRISKDKSELFTAPAASLKTVRYILSPWVRLDHTALPFSNGGKNVEC